MRLPEHAATPGAYVGAAAYQNQYASERSGIAEGHVHRCAPRMEGLTMATLLPERVTAPDHDSKTP
jgi:hypothetical protein